MGGGPYKDDEKPTSPPLNDQYFGASFNKLTILTIFNKRYLHNKLLWYIFGASKFFD
jgi:hypothetical protein